MREIDYQTIYKIVRSLVGNIEPAGDTRIVETRVENLNKHMKIMYMLVGDILLNIGHKNDPRASVKEIGKLSNNSLKQLSDKLNEILEQNNEENKRKYSKKY